MKRRGFTLLELLIVLAIIGVLAAILLPLLQRARIGPQRSACQSNLKQIGLGFLQYVRDYDERFPPLSLHTAPPRHALDQQPYGWAEALQPYLKSRPLFYCPAGFGPRSDDPRRSGYTDYWMNTRAAGQTYGRLHAPQKTVLSGDGNDGTDTADASYGHGALPAAWLDSADSPARRHGDGANYLFLDGHVKWFLPSTLENDKRAGRDWFRLQRELRP